jgi:hypothetical protein
MASTIPIPNRDSPQRLISALSVHIVLLELVRHTTRTPGTLQRELPARGHPRKIENRVADDPARC